MPMYDFHCHSCGNQFEKIVSYDISQLPIQCPDCEKFDSHRQPSAPLLGDSDRMFAQKKTSSGWKEVLRKIHKGSPGSRMTETSSIDFSSKE
jgi:putative FmdB family regulatory protein